MASTLKILKALRAARKAERRYQKENPMWNKEKSQQKAATAAKTAATGVVVTGGGIVAVLAFLRQFLSLPWGVDGDAAIAGVVTLVGVPVWTWIKTFGRDKAKHSSAAEPVEPSNTLTSLGIAVLLALSVWLMCAGCVTTRTLADGTIVEQRVDAQAASLIVQAAAALGTEATAFAERIYELQEAREVARTTREREEAQASLQRYIEIVQSIVMGFQLSNEAAAGSS